VATSALAPWLCATIATAAFAQARTEAVVHAEPLDEAGLIQEGIQLQANRVDPSACVLRWRDNNLPLPVAMGRIAVGRLGADRLAVLAAGVRESLVVYVMASGGSIARLATDDGRRLAPSFNGEGSWPVAIEGDVFLVPYEKDGRVEVRAFGFGERVFASRTFPAGVHGLRVAVEPRLHRISVVPLGVEGAAPLEFVHPSAPRIEFTDPVLDFGSVALDGSGRAVARLHNPSPEGVQVTVRVDGPFRLEQTEVSLAPDAKADLAVEFYPEAAREHRGKLYASHSGSERPLILPLRGTGVRGALAEAVLQLARHSDQERQGLLEPASQGQLPSVGTGPPTLSDAVAKGGRPDPKSPAAHALPPSPPTLEQQQDDLVLKGRAGEVVLLALVTVENTSAGPRPLLPLAAWRVRLSATEGLQRLSLATLGLEPDLGLIVLRREGPVVAESEVLIPDLQQVRQSGD